MNNRKKTGVKRQIELFDDVASRSNYKASDCTQKAEQQALVAAIHAAFDQWLSVGSDGDSGRSTPE